MERGNERFLELMIQPNLFREIADMVKKDKEGLEKRKRIVKRLRFFAVLGFGSSPLRLLSAMI